MSPTKRQMDVLRFVRGYQFAKGYSPTLSEIVVGLGIGSKGSVHRLLTGLEKAGLICRAKHRQQWIDVLTDIAVSRSPEAEPLFFVEVGR